MRSGAVGGKGGMTGMRVAAGGDTRKARPYRPVKPFDTIWDA